MPHQAKPAQRVAARLIYVLDRILTMSLRWRWIDPWQAYVIKNADSLSSMNNGQAVWSFDIFEIQHIEYRDVELRQAKAAMIRLFHEYDGNFIQLRLLHRHR